VPDLKRNFAQHRVGMPYSENISEAKERFPQKLRKIDDTSRIEISVDDLESGGQL
jgi:hypothetical protein